MTGTSREPQSKAPASEAQEAILRRYLEDAIAAESSFESQLRSFSEEGDDEEVRSFFALHAAQTREQYQRLADRLEQLGGAPSGVKSFFARLFGLVPSAVQATHRQEERTAQNLITAFSVERAECAIFHALAAVAHAAGDSVTETLARDFEAAQRQAADKIWRFIPSRAKIAFNMLTPNEIDPAVDTKAADDRVIG